MTLIADPVELPFPPAPFRPCRRPLPRRIVHWIRRGHLYLGLFLFPWAILYGVTGFLFNHPTALSDQPTKSFGSEALAGTPLEGAPSPNEQAEELVRKLNEHKQPATAYRLAGEARYAREFAFATVKVTEQGREQTVSVLVDLKNSQGTVRSAPPEAPKKEVEKAPFAIGRNPSDAPRGRNPGRALEAERPNSDAIKLGSPLPERVKAAIPAILKSTGFPTGEITVTSVPELTIPIEADGRIWTATYNGMTGSLSGKPAETEEKPEPSARRFLTRLHLAHGYPGEQNSRWFWALIVDAMSFVLCFWGLSGLIMWWQIKATRIAGAIVLLVSAAAAVALGFGMHAMMVG